MAWQTPPLSDVRRLARDYIAAYLPGADATIPNSVLRVLSDGNAGLAHLNLLYLDWLALQLLPDTAESEWLDRHAQIWLGGRKAATFAAGTVTVTGINGTALPLAARMASGNGVEYETTQAITVGAGATVVAVQAIDAGVAGNQVAGAVLTLSQAVSGVDAAATVVTMTGGVDAENDDDLRTRVLLRIRQPPMGGDATDYVEWALSVPGVTRAWSAPLEAGIGTVTVRFMMDELRATTNPSTSGFPLAGDVAAVKAYLDTVRPVAVRDFFVFAPTPEPINYTITNLSPDTTATRAALEASVAAMLKEKAAPGQTIFNAWVAEAAMQAAGVVSFDLTMADHVMPNAGALAVKGTVTYA